MWKSFKIKYQFLSPTLSYHSKFKESKTLIKMSIPQCSVSLKKIAKNLLQCIHKYIHVHNIIMMCFFIYVLIILPFHLTVMQNSPLPTMSPTPIYTIALLFSIKSWQKQSQRRIFENLYVRVWQEMWYELRENNWLSKSASARCEGSKAS